MFVLGLTGQSGAGKSSVAQLLAKHGFRIVDADKVARRVVEKDSPCLAALQEAFGGGILQPDGSLDRKKLAKAAFSDDVGVAKLNEITHPYIMARIKEELAELTQSGCTKAVLDAPALFEAGADSLCGKIMAVISPRQMRLERIMARDGISYDEADRRISAQSQDDYYTGRSDFIIENNGSAQELSQTVEHVIKALPYT